MNKYQLGVKQNGSLPICAFPGGYPIFYVTFSSDTLCAHCAAEQPENIEIHDIHWEGPPITCQGCNEEIESAYGEVEEN
jgi:hypothetical protein